MLVTVANTKLTALKTKLVENKSKLNRLRKKKKKEKENIL